MPSTFIIIYYINQKIKIILNKHITELYIEINGCPP